MDPMCFFVSQKTASKSSRLGNHSNAPIYCTTNSTTFPGTRTCIHCTSLQQHNMIRCQAKNGFEWANEKNSPKTVTRTVAFGPQSSIAVTVAGVPIGQTKQWYLPCEPPTAPVAYDTLRMRNMSILSPKNSLVSLLKWARREDREVRKAVPSLYYVRVHLRLINNSMKIL